MKSSIVHLSVPVSNHVYQFLKKSCGSDRYKPELRTFLGALILSSLHIGDHASMDYQKLSTPKTFTLLIHSDFIEINGKSFEKEKLKFLNNMLDRYIKEQVFNFALMNKLIDREKYIVSVRKYLESYEIYEDDFALENMYRDFKRKKERIQNLKHDNRYLQPTA